MELQTSSANQASRKWAENVLNDSRHRSSVARVTHLANWVEDAAYRKSFIVSNINDDVFYPFANPWNGETDYIQNVQGTKKLVRLSSREPGYLTLTFGSRHVRLLVDASGIVLGHYRFETISDMLHHFTTNNCAICLDALQEGVISVLDCGHALHSECIATLLRCPLCRSPFGQVVSVCAGSGTNYQALTPLTG